MCFCTCRARGNFDDPWNTEAEESDVRVGSTWMGETGEDVAVKPWKQVLW